MEWYCIARCTLQFVLDLLRMEQVLLVSSAVYFDYLQIFFTCWFLINLFSLFPVVSIINFFILI